ncbi:hypothetical protein PGTUg99_034485 [Puccinia graminis f. sp. tritici]|uniref:Uncharacterized protein n=1 Tax=Puccinia graminis f. sp. tritici TaxID=56615 RepID=A0A5B0N5Q9_PUCGR|nr:hypothetical protein PGTUg99_034485 [Puccinia graminis f. sp. tritici]
MKAQELDSHPALKPKEQAHVKSLLALIKADIENSDDEGDDERRAESDPTQLANDLPPSSASHESTLRVTSMPAVQSLHGDAPISHPQLDSSLPARLNFDTPTPIHEDRQYGLFRSMPVPKVLARTPCPSFGEFSRVDKTPVVDNGFPNVLNPAYANIPDDSPGRKNSRGETSYLTEEGDRFLDSVMASINQNQNLTPAQGNPVPPVPTPPADKQPPPAIPKRQSEHPVVIRERQERRPKYRFSTVRLEGIEDNDTGNSRKNRNRVDDSEDDEADDHGHLKKSRVEDESEEDPDAEGIPDDGEWFDPTQQKQQVAVILDHGIGHPAPFRSGPTQEATPRYHPLVDDFISLELMKGMSIPRNPTQGGSSQLAGGGNKRGAGGDIPENRSGRAPSVELFVPGQVLAPKEVDRWNNELARGIRWSHQSAHSALLNIQYLLQNLPPLLSAHAAIPEEDSQQFWKDVDVTSRLCESEDILNTAGNLSLITSDMVDMEQVRSFQLSDKVTKDHTLLPHLATFFAPGRSAYSRLRAALHQTWALKRLANLKDSWIPQAFDDDTNVYTAYYHFCGAYENIGGRMTDNTGAEPGVFSLIQYFIGALAGLAFLSGGCVAKPKQSKIDSYRSKHHLQHVQMLANLVIFGPTSAFTAYRTGPHVTLGNSLSLLEVGASLLKQKVEHGITAPMPHATLDNLRLYFLNFLIKMGFTQLDDKGLPQVNWRVVHQAFYQEFATHVISHMFAEDIEIALAQKRFGVV